MVGSLMFPPAPLGAGDHPGPRRKGSRGPRPKPYLQYTHDYNKCAHRVANKIGKQLRAWLGRNSVYPPSFYSEHRTSAETGTHCVKMMGTLRVTHAMKCAKKMPLGLFIITAYTKKSAPQTVYVAKKIWLKFMFMIFTIILYKFLALLFIFCA